MFREGETICVSHNKYGYHSIPLENAFDGKVTLVPPDPERPFEYVDSSELKLVTLNPIKGFRLDCNATAFRNFLIEMDYGTPKEQLEYVKKTGMPYSAIVFSGNKSLHFLISLDKDIPTEKIYRLFAEWTLAIVSLADQACKNPSRNIRIPGAMREPGKKQILVEMKGPVNIQEFSKWLNKYPDSKPKEKERKKSSEHPDFTRVALWVQELVVNGVHNNRNKTWFAIGCEFALAGYEEDDTIDILSQYFVEQRDFKEREWLSAITSAYKHIESRENVKS